MFPIDRTEDANVNEKASQALMEAFEKHVKVVQRVAGFTALAIDKEDVYIGTLGATLRMKTAVFIRDEEVKRNGLALAWTYKMEFSQETKGKFDDLGIASAKFGPATAEDIANAEADRDDGRDIGPVSLEFQMIPVKAPNGKDVPIGEVLAWLYINDAREEGGDAAAEEAFRLFYREKKAVLPKQDTNKPTSHVQGISKVSDKITEIINGETVFLDMGGRNEAKESVLTSLSLSYDAEGVQISKPMTPYDREVHNAVATLWAAGNRNITPRQVYQTMTGASGKPRQSAIANVEESLDKQRRTFVSLDFSKELRGRTAEFDGEVVTADQCRFETNMLNADKAIVTTVNGRENIGYIIKDAPILYYHDCTTRQLISYPQRLLEETSKVVSMTPKNILIRSYLLARIKQMSRKGSKQSKNIRYDAICEAAGISGTNRTERKRAKDTAKKLLDAFVQQGFIAGWTEYSSSGSTHKALGVTIKPAKND